MKRCIAILLSLCALTAVCAQSGTTTYNLTLTGSQILPPISDPSVGEAFLLVSFNTDSNNITYQLVADSVTELLVAHIHLPATSSMNGSVAIPLFQAQFDPIPGSATSGLIAAATVTPAMFVGPLEVLPDFTNVDVPTVLSEYVQQGRAYAQIHTMPYPDGALRAEFDSSLVVSSNPPTPTLMAPITVVV